MNGFDAYPFEGSESFGYEGDLGQVPTTSPNVPVVVTPTSLSLIQQMESFFKSPWGFLFLVAGGLFAAHHLGYLDLRKLIPKEDLD